jgi:hypothetical protein
MRRPSVFGGFFLLMASEISPDKIAAYHATHYRVGTGADGFTLRIGERSPELRRLYHSGSQSCGVFITAFNPFGQIQGDAENETAHSHLGDDLGAASSYVIEGEGADAMGLWPAEKSYLALGVNEESARSLGKHWRQDAVVWVGEDATPKLIVLR